MEKEVKQLDIEYCSDVEEDSLNKIRSIFLAVEFFIRLQEVSTDPKDPMQDSNTEEVRGNNCMNKENENDINEANHPTNDSRTKVKV
ncbi:hypothetical protein ACOSP7_004219 [Xanthoceras sorbifolium]